MKRPCIFTVGHSTRSIDEFVGLLRAQGVKGIADIRSIPMSRHNPQFNTDVLKQFLQREHRGGPGSSDSFCFFLKWEFLFLFLGCHGFWQAVEVYLIGRLRFQAGVWSGSVVEVDVAAERCSCLAD